MLIFFLNLLIKGPSPTTLNCIWPEYLFENKSIILFIRNGFLILINSVINVITIFFSLRLIILSFLISAFLNIGIGIHSQSFLKYFLMILYVFLFTTLTLSFVNKEII